MHSLLIVRNGTLVFEEYWLGPRIRLRSLFDYCPEESDLADGPKTEITLEHLLTTTSGLEWNQREVAINDESNDLIQMFVADDPYRYVLAKPLVADPGPRGTTAKETSTCSAASTTGGGCSPQNGSMRLPLRIPSREASA